MYVHVPFCAARCDYCAFATWTDRHHLMGDYAAACRAEIAGAALPAATSVYFGGGTPSLLPAELLVSILEGVPLAAGAEVTVEANPDTVTAALLGAYRAAGVNRLSFGVQSMDPSVLTSLGRTHDPGAVRRAVEAAGEAGFAERYSVDLIYGAVGETERSWRATLEAVLGLDPPPRHVSAYGLTVEPGTPLAADRRRYPDGDDQAVKYEAADRLLAGAGLEWYEISNWAVPGAESRHNRLYWAQGDYRGIGCSAHSHAGAGAGGAGVAGGAGSAGAGARRWWNVRTPDRYIGLISREESPVAAGEDLDAATRRRERLQLALRTRHGVPAGDLEDDPAIAHLVERREGRAVLTLAGRLLANEVALRIRD